MHTNFGSQAKLDQHMATKHALQCQYPGCSDGWRVMPNQAALESHIYQQHGPAAREAFRTGRNMGGESEPEIPPLEQPSTDTVQQPEQPLEMKLEPLDQTEKEESSPPSSGSGGRRSASKLGSGGIRPRKTSPKPASLVRFRCHYQRCPKLATEWSSQAALDEHIQAVHALQCPLADCANGWRGFPALNVLESHIYHEHGADAHAAWKKESDRRQLQSKGRSEATATTQGPQAQVSRDSPGSTGATGGPPKQPQPHAKRPHSSSGTQRTNNNGGRVVQQDPTASRDRRQANVTGGAASHRSAKKRQGSGKAMTKQEKRKTEQEERKKAADAKAAEQQRAEAQSASESEGGDCSAVLVGGAIADDY